MEKIPFYKMSVKEIDEYFSNLTPEAYEGNISEDGVDWSVRTPTLAEIIYETSRKEHKEEMKKKENKMSMTTSVRAFIAPTDPDYQKHKEVLIACVNAGIKELPQETAEYFGQKEPYMGLANEKLEIELPYKVYEEDSVEAYEIEAGSIPKGTAVIRFENSW
jgi:hypothetical protein